MSKKFTALCCAMCLLLGVFAREFFHLRLENQDFSRLQKENGDLRMVVTQARELADVRGSTTSMCLMTLSQCTDALDRALPIDRRELQPGETEPRFAQQRGP